MTESRLKAEIAALVHALERTWSLRRAKNAALLALDGRAARNPEPRPVPRLDRPLRPYLQRPWLEGRGPQRSTPAGRSNDGER